MYLHLRIGPYVCAEWNFGFALVYQNPTPWPTTSLFIELQHFWSAVIQLLSHVMRYGSFPLPYHQICQSTFSVVEQKELCYPVVLAFVCLRIVFRTDNQPFKVIMESWNITLFSNTDHRSVL
jgi:hypothetical protein